MADKKNIEIVGEQVTILKQTGVLTDPITGRELGIQQGLGKVFFKGEVVPVAEVSPIMIAALDDEDHPSHESVAKKIRYAGSDPKQNLEQRLGLPFAGYDDMEEEDIAATLPVLPSVTVERIKEYERANLNRTLIVDYNQGYGEHPDDRIEGRVSSPHEDPDEDKSVNALTTREVTEDGVQRGEGITGTGDPDIPHGTLKSEDEDSDRPKTAKRRSRRARPTAKAGDSDADKKEDGAA